MNVTEVKGHWCGSTYDGRLKYAKGSAPDVIVVNGMMYQYVPGPKDARQGVVTPEDHMRRETRGGSSV